MDSRWKNDPLSGKHAPGINFGAARAALSTATEGTTRGPNRAGRAQLVISLLPEGGIVPDGSAGLAAVPHLSERSCGAADFAVSLKTDSINRGKEAPVFGSQDPLFLNPSYPKTQVTESQTSTQVGDDWGILGVVCLFEIVSFYIHLFKLHLDIQLPHTPISI